jgi:tetratricopeptide (TPR) repeat protein
MRTVKSCIFAAALLVGASGVAQAADAQLGPGEKRLGHAVELITHGKYEDASKELRAALRENPELREAHYNLGVALRGLGAYDEAISELEYAEEQYARVDVSNRAKCYYAAALAKEARGDRDAWSEYLKFARKLPAERDKVQIAEEHQAALRRGQTPLGAQRASTK